MPAPQDVSTSHIGLRFIGVLFCGFSTEQYTNLRTFISIDTDDPKWVIGIDVVSIRPRPRSRSRRPKMGRRDLAFKYRWLKIGSSVFDPDPDDPDPDDPDPDDPDPDPDSPG